jgi:hypothetical protein
MSYDRAMDEHSATESGEQFVPYSSPSFRGRVVLAALGVGALLAIASIVVGLQGLDYLFLLQAGDATEEDWAEQVRIDDNWQWLVWAEVGAYLATVVAWCFWKHRCHRNLPALGAINLRFTSLTAVGCYFVPIVQIFCPYLAMREIRWGSNPRAGETIDCHPHWASGGFLVVAWWLTFFLGGTVTQLSNSTASTAASTDDARTHIVASYFLIAANGMFLVATLVAAWLVLDIVVRQERRAARNPKSE